ncbi:ABC transporter family protein,related [Neospora caninum Liverpool]|uniref:ABC transporter family protein, related n=1 Tax=Neospora caninum (strain Liverpool) TaxID=572307 RepID=F0VNV6_NEOCL|nr:ABC transporter family protein,related [Neospora caninum Liverpool]CBZ55402.1 ABC transporter family protein,related [Neospora caninum Liverpool]CEL70138.1 TPA: ABC transporter family protein, related [Neospora caninum Liverpool]|eukprot:XP_003885430.1 ABC transporter family protein,related [Neospora caninum Liverpool]
MPSPPDADSAYNAAHFPGGGKPPESLTSSCQKGASDDAAMRDHRRSTAHLSPVALDRETTSVSEPCRIPSGPELPTVSRHGFAGPVRPLSVPGYERVSSFSDQNGVAKSGIVQAFTPPAAVNLDKKDDSVQMEEADQEKHTTRIQVFIRFTNITYTPPRGLARQSLKQWVKNTFAARSLQRKAGSSASTSAPWSPSTSVRPRQILFGLSGYFAPGEMVGILGPSGAGKSTFLSVLCGRLKKGVGGLIEVNGKPAPARMKKIVGYVMQQEHFFGNLTVEETLMYTVRLRLGKKISFEEKKARVEEVIHAMKLNKCRGTRVGSAFCRGLSGGELKRLNIANELLLHPSLFLLDEPTSGLDASISAALLDMLKGLTRANRCTTVCTIHQPNSNVFMRFDRVIFLKDGHIVYQGKPSDVCAYFASLNFHCPEGWNIADYVMHVISASDDEDIRRRSITSATAAAEAHTIASIQDDQGRIEKKEAELSSGLVPDHIQSLEAPQEVVDVSADVSSTAGGSFTCRAARTSAQTDKTTETCLFGRRSIQRQSHEAGPLEGASENSNSNTPREEETDDAPLTRVCDVQPDLSATQELTMAGVMKHFCDGPPEPSEERIVAVLSAEASKAQDDDSHSLVEAYGRRLDTTTFQLRFHDFTETPVKDSSERTAHGCTVEERVPETHDCNALDGPLRCGAIEKQHAPHALLAAQMIRSPMVERRDNEEHDSGVKSYCGSRRLSTRSQEALASEMSKKMLEGNNGTEIEATHVQLLESLTNTTANQNIWRSDLVQQMKSATDEHCAGKKSESRKSIVSIHPCCCGLNGSISQRNVELSANAAPVTAIQVRSDGITSFAPKKMEWGGRKFSRRTSFLSFDEEIKVAMSEPSYFQQVWVLMCRGIRKELKGKSTLLDLAQAAVIGAVVGSLYFQSCKDYSEEKLMDRMGLLYFATAYYSFGPAYMAFTSFPAERAVISRERSSKAYRVSSYLFAKTVVDLVIQIPTPSLWLTIVYPLVGLPSDLGVFMAFWAQLVLLVCIAQAIGQLIAAIVVDDARLGGLLLSVILISSSISSGFYVKQERLGPWISWLRWLSFQNYAVTNFVIVTVGSSSTLSCSEFSSFPTCPEEPITAEMIIRRFTTALSPVSNATVMLCTWLTIKLMCYGVLKKSLKLKS